LQKEQGIEDEAKALIRNKAMRASPLSMMIVLAATVAATAAEQEVRIGDKFLPKPDTKPRIDERPGSWDEVKFPLTVEESSGDWLRVGKAWVRRDDVVPLGEAVTYYSEYIAQHPQDGWGYLMRAFAYLSRFGLAEAIRDLDEAIRLQPDAPEALRLRGALRDMTGQRDGAIADYTAALKLKPRFARALAERGNVWRQKKELDKAIADYNEALDIDPQNFVAVSGRGVAWDLKGESDKALADYTQAIKLNPAPATLVLRALSLEAKGDLSGAAADLTEALRLDPRDDAAFFHRGRISYQQGKLDEAIRDFTDVLKIKPKTYIAFLNRGKALQGKGDLDKALADYQEASRIKPNFCWPLAHSAWICATASDATQRDGRRATTLATKACELAKWKESFCLEALAAASAESSDFPAAVKWQTKALELITAEKDKKAARTRLELYQSGAPYREEPKAPPIDSI
jgi:tetratricopeptide (TPR) repeat protein